MVRLIPAIFTENGSLGISFEAANPQLPPTIKGLKPGTQAEKHLELEVGMTLGSVAGVNCEQKPYKEVIALIKQHPERPVELCFLRPPVHPCDEALLLAGEEGWVDDIECVMKTGTIWVDTTDEFSGNTCLMNACVNNHLDCVVACLARNANMESLCALEQTAIIKAAGFGHAEIVSHLLANKAEVETVDHREMTAFLYACEYGHAGVVEILVSAGCARNGVNREGFGGRQLAEQFGRAAVVEVLDGHGGSTPRNEGVKAHTKRMGKAGGKERVAREAGHLRGMSVLQERDSGAMAAATQNADFGSPRMDAFAEEGEEDEDEEEENDAGGGDIRVSFADAGSLGLKFTSNAAGAVEVMGINPGTQATRHPQLKPGLVLKSVGSTDVTGMEYKAVINVIKSNPSRPLAVSFVAGGGGGDIRVSFADAGSLGLKFTSNAAGAVEVMGINPGTQATRHPQLKPGLVLKSVGSTDVTGMEYKAVINVIKSNPSRPLAVSFVAGGGGGGSTRAPAAAPRTAPAARAPQSDVSVTFSDAGSLGLKFTPNRQTGAVEVLAINSGTQATRHPQLKPGLVLKSVGSTDVAGMAYPDVINVIKSNPGRPLSVGFNHGQAPPPAAAASAPATHQVQPPRARPVQSLQSPVALTMNQQYTCTRRSMIRAGFSMESEKAGILEEGDVITVMETRVNEANTTRVRSERGWTNATMTDGSKVFDVLKCESL